ncbi:hypothetical protein MNBD_GAMMA15-2243 [hydrothermal vent metagenome]|uniref:SPOR domain-containing protein n=1 Tax=hydrothermal vent metagenome TaxID=652676 RepID=A0A3B0Y5W6_9ZZZZ
MAELPLELPTTPLPVKDADSSTEQLDEPVAAEDPEIQTTDTQLAQTESIPPPQPEQVPETGKTVASAEKHALPSPLGKPESGETLKPLDSGLRRDDDIQGIGSTAEVTVNTATPGLPHREDWLIKQQPTDFTLQLLGSREQSSIATYVKRHALDPAKTAYYRGRYRDADWYVLLYGIYPDKTTALAARSTLPAKVQKGKPWSRSLKSVQDSINEVP